MTRCGLAFNQRDAASLSSERDRSGTACHSTTEDQNFVLQSIAPKFIWMFNQFVAGFPISSRCQKNSLARHSVQIVILEPVSSWLDGCTCRGENMLDSPGGGIPERV